MTTNNSDKIVTRIQELELFQHLLQRRAGAQILAIEAASGTGKSVLLEQFSRHCRTQPTRIPVSLVDLKDQVDSSPLALVRLLYKNLTTRSELTFPTFTKLEEQQRTQSKRLNERGAMASGSKTASDSLNGYAATSTPITPGVQLYDLVADRISDDDIHELCFRLEIDYTNLGAATKDARFRALILLCQCQIIFDRLVEVIGIVRPDLLPELSRLPIRSSTASDAPIGSEQLINAFFADLRQHAEHASVVVMFDTFERWEESNMAALREWFMDSLFEQQILGTTAGPASLLVVLAGRRVPVFADDWPATDCERAVTHHKLTPLDKPLFQECLLRHCPRLSVEDINSLWPWHYERGVPIVQILTLAQSAVGTQI